MLRLVPYFHPTTICVVDDSESFLSSLRFELPDDLAYRLFSTPARALEHINAEASLVPLADRCFSMERDQTDGRTVIHLDLDIVEQEIKQLERFRRVSVVVVDYAMPFMNGLEFCAKLEDPYLKRVLLTGAADEKLAVEAFNAGLIDRFIPKQQHDPAKALLTHIRDLQRAFFEQHAARLVTTLALDAPGFLEDAAFASHMTRLMQTHGFVEYYLVDDPPGFLLMDSAGNASRLVILTPAQLAEQAALAGAHRAPSDICAALGNARAVGAFAADAPAGYFGDEAYPWRENLAPATILAGTGTGSRAGSERWHVGLFEDAPLDIDFDPRRSCYNAYLESLSLDV